MLDYLLLGAYGVILGTTKTRDSFIAYLCFGASAFYTMTDFYNSIPAWIDHLIIPLILFPAIILSTKYVCLAFSLYAAFHWLTAGEYIFSNSSTILIGKFEYIATLLNLLIMAALFYGRHNYINDKNGLLADSWIISLCHRYRQTSSDSSKGKNQC